MGFVRHLVKEALRFGPIEGISNGSHKGIITKGVDLHKMVGLSLRKGFIVGHYLWPRHQKITLEGKRREVGVSRREREGEGEGLRRKGGREFLKFLLSP